MEPRRKEDYLPYYLRISSACNQKCAFCNSVSNAGDDPPDTVIAEQLRELRDGRMISTVTFAGGEPTLSKHLLNSVREAHSLNFDIIGLETNGLMLSYRRYADALADAGLTHVRIMLVSADESLSDSLTCTPGAWKLTCKGIEWAVSRGLHVTVQLPLIEGTISGLAETVRFVADRFTGVNRIELRMTTPGSESQDVIPAAVLENELVRAVEAAREKEIKMSFKACCGLAPCLLKEPDILTPLYNFQAVDDSDKPGYETVSSCVECLLGSVCPGIHPAYVREDRAGNLEKITPSIARKILRPGPGRRSLFKDDIRRQANANFCTFFNAMDENGCSFVREAMLRINYTCNQRCLFCWIDPNYDNLPHEAVVKKIEEIGRAVPRSVSITGGEPTLNPHLAEYVARVKAVGVNEICLQTNAMLLDDKSRVDELIAAGLNSAFVSLHSNDPEISDMLTGVGGGFDRTVKGITNLIRGSAVVFLSHVINSFNYKLLPDFVEFISRRFERVPIVFSYAAPIYGAMMHRGLIPPLSEVRDVLIKALEKCYELKVPFSGLAGMCGLPPCILDGELRYYPDINRVAEADYLDDMVKAPCCAECSLDGYCFGMRRYYAEIYGTGELKSVQVADVKPVILDYVKPEDFYKQIIL